MLAFRKEGPSAAAKSALKNARKRNAYVPGMLTGAVSTPKHIADYFTLGSKEEAVIYVLQNKENWSATPGALQWLAETARTLTPPPKNRR